LRELSAQKPEPLKTTLSGLLALLQSRDHPDQGRPLRLRDGDNSTAIYQLSRISELPQIRKLAEQLGLCRVGEFSAATVQVIADRLCVHGRLGQKHIDPTQAFSLRLSLVVQFLERLLAHSHRTGVLVPAGIQPAEEPLPQSPRSATPMPPRLKGRRDKKIEARDRWIYKRCCARVPYKEIIVKLSRRQAGNGWRRITSKQGIQNAARRYAERHQLELPPPRQNL
jgi:hypothetical protein